MIYPNLLKALVLQGVCNKFELHVNMVIKLVS